MMIITTTNSVEGNEITEYLGLVYGTDIYLVGGLVGGGLVNQENLFGTAYKSAVEKMISKAEAVNANAIVGIQTNYTAPGNRNNMIVVVTGTAVKVSPSNELPEL